MIKAILTDIEGTTSSISFVKDVLFPYAAKALPDYIRQHADEPAVAEQLKAVAEEAGLALEDREGQIAALLQWIAEDKKLTPLKALQGLVWQAGYQNGDYQAHVYADAVTALQAWKAQGLSLCVYSSGSIKAQKLFFGYSEAGDLRPLFSDYFDTTSGSKQEPDAYVGISEAMGFAAHEILFLSDIIEELDAAKQAGMQTCLLVREADTRYQKDGLQVELHIEHPFVCGFDEIELI
jgi:enolase-phosphatase E1